ncbi:hypothetical protein V6N13_051213 [Hibiscus sabdariffa]|uniref:Uncharacterized protein n=1 Tax=Hibiscus sabdariffa TaxID=183260 RepID=A0ABR2T2W4_9ROSI
MVGASVGSLGDGVYGLRMWDWMWVVGGASVAPLLPWLVLGKFEVVIVKATVYVALGRRCRHFCSVGNPSEQGETLVEGLVEQGWVEPKCGLELLNRESEPDARSPFVMFEPSL